MLFLSPCSFNSFKIAQIVLIEFTFKRVDIGVVPEKRKKQFSRLVAFNQHTLFVWLLEFAVSTLLEMLGLLKSPKAKKLFTYKLQIFADMPQKRLYQKRKTIYQPSQNVF